MAVLEVRSPNDGKLIKTISLEDGAAAERKLSRAVALFADRSARLKPHERVEILEKTASLVENEAESFAMLIAAEGGKPLADARIEVTRAIQGIKLAASEMLRIMRGEEIPMGYSTATEHRRAFTTMEPIGVVIAISAFNHPLNLIVHQAMPAVAAGCPVIVKPASTTPLCCLRLCELLSEAGLPEGWVQPIVCTSAVAEQLATDPRIAFLSFIGSANVGWMLRSKLAPGVRCALEHGGAAPVIVDVSADLDKAVPALLKGGFYHAGQVCVSVQRVYAHQSIAETLAERLADGAKQLVVGDARDAKTQVGPMIQAKEVNRIHDWITQAVENGATLLCGGKKVSEHYYAPTVLFNPPDDAQVTREEAFGPLVCVYEYATLEEAITRANAVSWAFQAAIFAQDIHTAMMIAERFDASAVMINDHTAFRADWMPFGGRRASGLGMGGIGDTLRDLLQLKLIVMNTA